jgi:hypothetical protein
MAASLKRSQPADTSALARKKQPASPKGRNPRSVGAAYARCKSGRRDDLGGIYLRSAWEANYARYLDILMKWTRAAGPLKLVC